MVWTAPKTWTAAVVTAAELNLHVRDNLAETAPAKATTPGSVFVSSGPNSISERTPNFDKIIQGESTSTVASYVDLFTTGPQVTLETGSEAIFFMMAIVKNTMADSGSFMTVEVSGASNIAASANHALIVDGIPANNSTRFACYHHETNLTPGLNTFTSKYRVDSGTGTWSYRELIVFPL